MHVAAYPKSSLALTVLASDLDEGGYRLRLWRGRTSKVQCLEEARQFRWPLFAFSLAGSTRIVVDGQTITLGAEQALMMSGRARPEWVASGGHRLLWLEVSPAMIRRVGEGMKLREEVEKMLDEEGRPGCSGPLEVSQDVLSLAQQLIHPPSHLVSLPVWYRAKVTEMAAMWFFSPDRVHDEQEETASSMKQKLGRDLVKRAVFLLERDLENPPGLEILASELGCSVFQLSRFFAVHTGISMPQYLRRKRMERAAALLHTTQMGVSEVSLSVGYTSFSAFTRAFVREIGDTPTKFRAKRG